MWPSEGYLHGEKEAIYSVLPHWEEPGGDRDLFHLRPSVPVHGSDNKPHGSGQIL